MRALVIDKEKKLKVGNIEKPVPNGKDVIVKVSACGICGSDIHYWDIGQPQGLVMGHEYCGVVEDAGSRKDLKKGDRVTALPISPCLECDSCKSGNIHYCANTWTYATGLSLTNSGGYAEYMAIRPDMVRKVPNSISDEEVAMVEPSAVALHGVHLANIKVGDKVLVIGGGIIGLMSAEFARLQGASYIAMTETNLSRGKFAKKVNAVDESFNALDKKLAEKLDKVAKGGFDVVIECVGNAPAVSTAIQYCKAGGTIVLVGVSLTPITIPTTSIVMKEQKVLGAIAYTEKEFDSCIDLIANKKLDVKKYISKVVGLASGQKSFETLTSGKDSAIKIILRPDIKK
ncbi:MAG: alcohol dehydrogenase catalytic domain-containing protein [Clostridia bacterium]|nr:alcohol dehydrogenase catalytic domain-containing protein [Clostridia bacterium]